MRAGRELRRLVMNRIIAEVPAFDGRVYDRATQDDIYPYCTLGPSSWTDDSVDCIKGRVQTLQIDVWAEATKGVCEDLTDDVSAALADWGDENALTMHSMRIVMVRVLDDPNPEIAHGVVQVEAMVELPVN